MASRKGYEYVQTQAQMIARPSSAQHTHGLSVSHATHLLVSAMLGTMQTEHVHPLGTCGLTPAAAQLNAVGAEDGGAVGIIGVGAALVAPTRGSSHALHFSASALLGTMQVPHVHPLATGAFMPAAAQLNTVGADVAGAEVALSAPGCGSSQETHLSASVLFETIQVPHVQPLIAGAFIPDAAQLNDAGAVCAAVLGKTAGASAVGVPSLTTVGGSVDVPGRPSPSPSPAGVLPLLFVPEGAAAKSKVGRAAIGLLFA
jgi:hypothetical protein